MLYYSYVIVYNNTKKWNVKAGAGKKFEILVGRNVFPAATSGGRGEGTLLARFPSGTPPKIADFTGKRLTNSDCCGML